MRSKKKSQIPALPDTDKEPGLRWALYRRVSGRRQVEKDLSLPEQARQQQDYVAARLGLIVAEYEDRGIPGKTTEDRPAFLEMVDAAKRHEFDVLLIHKSDRSFRSRYDAVVHKFMFRKLGIAMRSVMDPWFGGEDPEDKVLEGFHEISEEYYSENLSREVKKGIRSRAIGRRIQHGLAPYGYRQAAAPSDPWEIDEEAAHWVRWIFAEFAGGEGFASVARHLNLLGVASPGHGPANRKEALWSRQSVRYILGNRVYLGVIRHEGEWRPGSQPAIVPPELYDHIQSILDRRGYGRSETSDALFAGGLLLCPHCWAVGERSILGVRKQQKPYMGYQCAAHAREQARVALGQEGRFVRCPGFHISERRAIRLLAAYLTAKAEEVPGEGIEMHDPLESAKTPATEEMARRWKAEIAEMPEIRRRLSMQEARGLITPELLEQQLASVAAREMALKTALAESEEAALDKPTPRLVPASARRLLARLADSEVPTAARRDALREVIEAILPSPDKAAITVFLCAPGDCMVV